MNLTALLKGTKMKKDSLCCFQERLLVVDSLEKEGESDDSYSFGGIGGNCCTLSLYFCLCRSYTTSCSEGAGDLQGFWLEGVAMKEVVR